MSEQDTNGQTPTSNEKNDQATSKQQQQQQQPETGAKQDAETTTVSETDQQADESQTEETGEAQSGFIASKDEDSGDYLREKGEQSGRTDIDGESNFGENGE